MSRAALVGHGYVLCHVPELVRYGSKPMREPNLTGALAAGRRDWEHALSYPPHQVYIGALTPAELEAWPRPWWRNPVPDARQRTAWGEILPQADFYRGLRAADQFELIGEDGELPLYDGVDLVGCVRRGHPVDHELRAEVLLENLAAKVTGSLALRKALEMSGLGSGDVEYVMNCGEEAVGDRYQRGGGNLGKAVAELAGCENAGAADVKAFCCGPAHALVLATSLVESGVHDVVAVVAGGSLAKLGMKSRGHLAKHMPVLEDVLAGAAFLIGRRDDARVPRIRLDVIGRHRTGSGSSQQAILADLVLTPLARAGRRLLDVDRYAPELHNPELTEPAGSGNVPRTNYRMLASLAVMAGEWERERLDCFESERGLPGWAPTQGHIASGIPYIGHAMEAMKEGSMRSAMILAKGSLFLGRMTRLSDGCSFLIETGGNE